MTDSKELSVQQKFEETIKDRLREDIGKLIPDEALTKMIEKAMQEMFFTRRQDSSGYKTVERPSWFEDEVEKVLRGAVHKQVKDWLSGNEDELRKSILECIEKNLPKILAEALLNGFTSSVYGASGHVVDDMMRAFAERLQRGY